MVRWGDSDQHHVDTETMTKSKAQLAADRATKEMFLDPQSQKPSRLGLVALYAWGGLSLFCALFAVTAGLVPGLGDSTLKMAHSFFGVEDRNSKIEIAELHQQDIIIPKVIYAPKDVADENVDTIVTGAVEPTETTESVEALQKEISEPNEPSKVFFGVDIGGSPSLEQLSVRFAALQRRAPDLFEGLTPKVQLNEDDKSLGPRLIAGPFTSKTEQASFCRSLRLRLTIDCLASAYEGDPIEIN